MAGSICLLLRRLFLKHWPHGEAVGGLNLVPCKNLTISFHLILKGIIYSKVVSSNTSCLEANADFFRLLVKGIFDPYILSSFDFLISKAR